MASCPNFKLFRPKLSPNRIKNGQFLQEAIFVIKLTQTDSFQSNQLGWNNRFDLLWFLYRSDLTVWYVKAGLPNYVSFVYNIFSNHFFLLSSLHTSGSTWRTWPQGWTGSSQCPPCHGPPTCGPQSIHHSSITA